MDSLKKIKAEKIHLTLTLGEVDALVIAGQLTLVTENLTGLQRNDLTDALQKMDAAVNL